jgi:hypothetical protein
MKPIKKEFVQHAARQRKTYSFGKATGIAFNCFLVLSVFTSLSSDRTTRKYHVPFIQGDITLSGKGDDPQWQQAASLSDFVYPWETGTPPLTQFQALHNDEWLYCLFTVNDDHAYVHEPGSNDKRAVVKSSRAEIFFRRDEGLNPYYCLEIDPTGRVYDYEARYHRAFDPTWSWPDGALIIETDRTPTTYTVEIAISKASLKALGLLRDNRIEAGLFRADRIPNTQSAGAFKWISWVMPDATTPDFHIPSAFGVLELESRD